MGISWGYHKEIQRIWFGRLKIGKVAKVIAIFIVGLVNPGWLGLRVSIRQARCLDQSSFKVSEIGTVPPWKCLLTWAIQRVESPGPVPSLRAAGIPWIGHKNWWFFLWITHNSKTKSNWKSSRIMMVLICFNGTISYKWWIPQPAMLDYQKVYSICSWRDLKVNL